VEFITFMFAQREEAQRRVRESVKSEARKIMDPYVTFFSTIQSSLPMPSQSRREGRGGIQTIITMFEHLNYYKEQQRLKRMDLSLLLLFNLRILISFL
jgi:hypothetical protein